MYCSVALVVGGFCGSGNGISCNWSQILKEVEGLLLGIEGCLDGLCLWETGPVVKMY